MKFHFSSVLILLCFKIYNSDMPRLVESTLVLLCQKSACQQVESDSDSEDEDDPGHHELLMDAVTDLLPASAKALGSHFALIFATLFDPLMESVVSLFKIISC